MIFKKTFQGLASLFFIILFFASSSACAQVPKKLPIKELKIQRQDGSLHTIRAEIAANDEDRQKGLMLRKRVPDGEGMLFIFDYDQRLSFWMKDTLVPLSIAYIASDGKILEIYDMQAQSLSTVNSERSARYALELAQGSFDRARLAVGDYLLLEGLSSR
ncbi:DUF192 domain-containing protein [Treponema sp.]